MTQRWTKVLIATKNLANGTHRLSRLGVPEKNPSGIEVILVFVKYLAKGGGRQQRGRPQGGRQQECRYIRSAGKVARWLDGSFDHASCTKQNVRLLVFTSLSWTAWCARGTENKRHIYVAPMWETLTTTRGKLRYT